MEAPNLLNISIPKFRLETKLDLKSPMTNLGMSSVFTGTADLSGMTGEKNLSITGAWHQAYIEVNEKGTEAAAATAIVIGYSSPATFYANRPFLYVIRDNRTKNVLFVGRYVTAN